MQLYHLTNSADGNNTYRYQIEATHIWLLPGVICPICHNTWTNTGTEYPLVNLTPLPTEKSYREARAVPLEEYNRLRDALRAYVPPRAPLPPGTEFGPLRGKARGTFGDFAWPDKWTALIREDVLAKLMAEGVRMPPGAQTQLVFLGKNAAPNLLELQVFRHARLAEAALPTDGAPPCAGCERRAIKKPAHIIVEGTTIPEHVDVFRMDDLTTHILATERFKNVVERLRLTDISFEEVKVA